jgi:hypothetical protein
VAGEDERVTRDAQHRPERRGDQGVEAAHERFGESAVAACSDAELGRGRVDLAVQGDRPTAVERVGEGDVGVGEWQVEPERSEGRRRCGERHDGGTEIVAHPGDEELGGARAAAHRRSTLEHDDAPPGTGEAGRRRQPVRSGADDDCGAGRVGRSPRRRRHASDDRCRWSP